jgi:hypothetical protein
LGKEGNTLQVSKSYSQLLERSEMGMRRWLKYLAPRVLRNSTGEPVPCECTEDLTCSYCTLAASLLFERDGIETKADFEKFIRALRGEKDSLIAIAKKLRNKKKLAKMLGVNERTLRRWIEAGKIPNSRRKRFSRILDEITT